MYPDRYRRKRHLVFLIGLLSLALAPISQGYADYTEDERITDDTAYTLRDGELRVGVWKVEYGLMSDLTISTYTAPWLIKAGNAGVKWEYEWASDTSLALRLHILKFDPSALSNKENEGQSASAEEEPSAKLWILPVELLYSQRIDPKLTASASWLYNRVILAGEGGSEDEVDVQGAAAVTTGQFTGTLQYNVSEIFALLLHARYLAYQDITVGGNLTRTQKIEPDITLEFAAAANTESDVADVQNAYSIIPSVQLSWGSFNLRCGVGYGNWSVPIVNFVIPEKSKIFDFDLYWRF
jgi:hypothetical protein